MEMRRLVLSLLAIALAGCSRAPLASPAALPALQAQARDPMLSMRPIVETLMDRCFVLMTTGYGRPKATIDANDFAKFLVMPLEHATSLVKAIDTDGDQQATQAELRGWGVARDGLVRMNDVVVAPAFKAADLDGDHKLRPDEAAKAAIDLQTQQRWPLGVEAKDFAAFDANQDGKLAELEFDKLAAAKVQAGLKTDQDLPPKLAQLFFKTVPWSH
jgi:hypothetical protein